jgi:hypothetical protein
VAIYPRLRLRSPTPPPLVVSTQYTRKPLHQHQATGSAAGPGGDWQTRAERHVPLPQQRGRRQGPGPAAWASFGARRAFRRRWTSCAPRSWQAAGSRPRAGGGGRRGTRTPSAAPAATPEVPRRAPCASREGSPSSGSPSSTASSGTGTPSASRWRRKVSAVVLPHYYLGGTYPSASLSPARSRCRLRLLLVLGSGLGLGAAVVWTRFCSLICSSSVVTLLVQAALCV